MKTIIQECPNCYADIQINVDADETATCGECSSQFTLEHDAEFSGGMWRPKLLVKHSGTIGQIQYVAFNKITGKYYIVGHGFVTNQRNQASRLESQQRAVVRATFDNVLFAIA